MADWNRVTERGHAPANATLWLVSTEWRGGHDGRLFQLGNLYLSEKDARREWEAQTIERHNAAHGYPVDYDSGFRRLPLRKFVETSGE